MTTKELNSYRLTSLEEPTDEQLDTIMRKVALRKYRNGHSRYIILTLSSWKNGFNLLLLPDL